MIDSRRARARRGRQWAAAASQAIARHPKVFSRLYISMVEAGDAAGVLTLIK